MIVFEFVFFGAIFAVAYTVLIYPVILFVLGGSRRISPKRDNRKRSVDLVIPVCNGEKEIELKIKNCLNLDYPEDALNIVVVSDGSEDRTVEIVRKYEGRRLRCIALKEKVGKVAAQNFAVKSLSSEIVVFTDVSILVEKNAVRDIVSNFADDAIGAVSCRDQIEQLDEKEIGDAAYINYDMVVRKFANRIGSMIGVTGGFYAVRRVVAEGPWNAAFPPDFFAALRAIKLGFRVIEDPRVVACYYTAASGRGEMDRKIRTITRGMWAMLGNCELLNPFRYGFVSFQLFSHKLMRWLTPIFFLCCLFSNAVLALAGESLFFGVTFVLQLIFYFLSIVSFFRLYYTERYSRVVRVPAMWLMFNLSLLISWKNLLTGKKIVKWAPTVRNLNSRTGSS